MEADLAFRGFDLLDMWRGELTPRKVDVLIRGLPPDSATRIAMNKREPLWTRTDFLLADVVDATNANTWMVQNKDVPERNRAPFPEPYPRPGYEPPKKISAAALESFRKRTAPKG